MTYDAFGRLWKRHAPEQQVDPYNGSSTDHSTFSYNADDTLSSASDARGATSTFTYNARKLVTHISYAAPTVNPPGSSIPVPAAVDFAYDAVGNRTSINDGLGYCNYNYNELSQLISELHHVNEPYRRPSLFKSCYGSL